MQQSKQSRCKGQQKASFVIRFSRMIFKSSAVKRERERESEREERREKESEREEDHRMTSHP